jgi:hypothetical protein
LSTILLIFCGNCVGKNVYYMVRKKYQVFLSSTYQDLKDERRLVIETIIKSDCMPVGMEFFPASPDDPLKYIKKIIDDSDFYLLIIRGRYGTIPKNEKYSFTELEYEYAKSVNKKIIAFIYHDIEGLCNNLNDKRTLSKIKKFIKKLDGISKPWGNKYELSTQVVLSLNELRKSPDENGWVKATFENISYMYKNMVNSEELITKDELSAVIVGHTDKKRQDYFEGLYLKRAPEDIIKIMGTGVTSFLRRDDLIEVLLRDGNNIQLLLINNQIVKSDWLCSSEKFIERYSECGVTNNDSQVKNLCDLSSLNILIERNHFNRYHSRSDYDSRINESVALINEIKKKFNSLKGRLDVRYFKSFVPLSMTAIYQNGVEHNDMVAEFIIPFSHKRIIFNTSNNKNSEAYKIFIDFFDSTWAKSSELPKR